MGRRNDHSREQIREMALDAAARLLAETGPAGLSARKVAGEIGYTVGTLYLVFDNLDDLILQVNLRTLKQLRAQILAATNPSEPPVAQLKAIAATYIDFASQQEHLWRMIYEHAPTPKKSDSLEEYEAVSASLLTHIEDVLGQLIAGDKNSIALHARALWGGVHGVCVLSLADKLDQGKSGSLRAITDLLVERFVSGGKVGQ